MLNNNVYKKKHFSSYVEGYLFFFFIHLSIKLVKMIMISFKLILKSVPITWHWIILGAIPSFTHLLIVLFEY